MTTERKIKKDKEIVLELENQIRDIRQQFTDQLRCLDQRVECHVGMMGELQEFYRRQAEAEVELSQRLEKIVKQISQRHKSEKQRREQWKEFSTYTTWQELLSATKRQIVSHNALGDLYGTLMTNKLTDIVDDMNRVYKKCRDMVINGQNSLFKALTELRSAMKTYHDYLAESQQAEGKLLRVQSLRIKEQNVLSKKLRGDYEKQSEKKQAKFKENNLKAVKARNDYILCISVANAAINKYFTDDLPQIVQKMDYGYHTLLVQALSMHLQAEQCMMSAQRSHVDVVAQQVLFIKNTSDATNFQHLYARTFTAPDSFEFQPHKGDKEFQLSAKDGVQGEMLSRFNGLRDHLQQKKTEREENRKMLERVEMSLMEKIAQTDLDISQLFESDEKSTVKSPLDKDKRKTEKLQIEETFLNIFNEYLQSDNLIARLQVKYDLLQKALTEVPTRPPALPPKPKGRRPTSTLNVRIFGGNLIEYFEVTGQEIPNVVQSCVRIINLYGMHHQGVFRVSGSQNEINNYKSLFDKGEDPFSKSETYDINSVAGLLKLYFRELKDPLFPGHMFHDLIAAVQKYNSNDVCKANEWVATVRSLLATLPRPVLVVMRYLFAFLNHLSENSDENMMDAYNLAICFGPNLLPVPGDLDLVLYQSFVNDVIKSFIVHHEELFPYDYGASYEKCIVDADGDKDYTDVTSDDDGLSCSTVREEDEECDDREATAQFDFDARTDRELSFKKGDVITLTNKVSADWWEASVGNKTGLVPEKYIVHKHLKTSNLKLSESLRRSTECLMSANFGSNLDRAASQPNIASKSLTLPPSEPIPKSVPTGKVTNAPTNLPSTAQSKNGQNADQSKDVTGSSQSAIGKPLSKDANDNSLTSANCDLAEHIDSALAKVMSGIHSLDELQQRSPVAEVPVVNFHPPSPEAERSNPLGTAGNGKDRSPVLPSRSPSTKRSIVQESNVTGISKESNTSESGISGVADLGGVKSGSLVESSVVQIAVAPSESSVGARGASNAGISTSKTSSLPTSVKHQAPSIAMRQYETTQDDTAAWDRPSADTGTTFATFPRQQADKKTAATSIETPNYSTSTTDVRPLVPPPDPKPAVPTVGNIKPGPPQQPDSKLAVLQSGIKPGVPTEDNKSGIPHAEKKVAAPVLRPKPVVGKKTLGDQRLSDANKKLSDVPEGSSEDSVKPSKTFKNAP